MLIADRNGMVVGSGGWRNPYVTDGLVAMWDGEWKNEPGVPASQLEHEYWTDIVGGHNIPLSNTNGKVFPGWADYGDKYIDFNAGKYVTWASRISIGTVSSEEITLELAVALYPGSSSDTFYAVNTIYCGNGGKYILPFNQTSYYTPTSGGGMSSHNFSSFSLDEQVPSTVSLSCKTGTQVMYVDATSIATSSSTWSGVGAISQFGLGSYNADKGRIGLRYFCVRLYNRALTSAEIAANHAIDSIRFNLTGGGVNA